MVDEQVGLVTCPPVTRTLADRSWLRKVALLNASIIGCATFIAVAAVITRIDSSPPPGAGAAAGLLTVVVLTSYVVRTLRAAVHVDEESDSLAVVNPFRCVRIRRGDIEGYEPRQAYIDNYYLRIRYRDGAAVRRLAVTALPFSVVRDPEVVALLAPPPEP